MGSVNGKVALITGGARGVGAEVARRGDAECRVAGRRTVRWIDVVMANAGISTYGSVLQVDPEVSARTESVEK